MRTPLRLGVAIAVLALCAVFGASVSQAAPPSNDDFASPTEVFSGVPVNGSNVDATIEGGETTPVGWTLHHSSWFEYVPTSSGTMSLSVCSTFPSNVIMMTGTEFGSLSLLSGSPASYAQGTSSSPCLGGSYPVNINNIDVIAGTSIRIHVGSAFAGQTGTFAMLATLTDAPANDDFDNRTKLYSRIPQSATNLAASAQAGEANNPYSNYRTVWYEYRAAHSTNFDLEVCADFPVNVVAYSGGSVDSLTPVGNAQALSTGVCGPSRYRALISSVTTAENLSIQVGGAYGKQDAGDFDIELRLNSAPDNDQMFQSQILDSGDHITDYSDNTYATHGDFFTNEAFPDRGKSVFFHRWVYSYGEFSFNSCGSSVDTVTQVFLYMAFAAYAPDSNADGGCPSGGGDKLKSYWATPGNAILFEIASKANGPGGPVVANFDWDPEAANNMFASASELNDGDELEGTLKGTNSESGEPTPAVGSNHRSAWYRFTAPGNGEVSFNTCESDFDTVVAAWVGPAVDSLTPLSGSSTVDDGCVSGDGSNLQSQSVTTGQTVYFAVYGATDVDRGDFTAAFEFAAAPENDNFADAEPIDVESASIGVNNENATLEIDEPRFNGSLDHSVWYEWTAPANGELLVSACNDNDVDSVVAVYEGNSLGSLTSVDGDDAECEGESGMRIAGISVSESVTYRIQVAGENTGDVGETTFSLLFASPPPNDTFESATDFESATSVEYSDDNYAAAANQPNEPMIVGAARPASVWYRWQAPVSGTVTIETCDELGTNTALGVFTTNDASPALSNLTSVNFGSAVGGCSAGDGAKVTFAVESGSNYWFAVANDSAADWRGPFTLKLGVHPTNTVLPSISGDDHLVGTELTLNPGTWVGKTAISLAYQWMRCDADGNNCSDIAGETDLTYTLAAADVDQTVRATVTGTNSLGSTGSSSGATALIDKDSDGDTLGDRDDECPSNANESPKTNGCPVETLTPTVLPTFSGTLTVGSTLTGTNGTWSYPGIDPSITAPTFEYEWWGCDSAGASCVKIAGADQSTYTLQASDVGKYIRLRVLATNEDGFNDGQSTHQGPVAAAVTPTPPSPTPPPATPVPNPIGLTIGKSILSVKLPRVGARVVVPAALGGSCAVTCVLKAAIVFKKGRKNVSLATASITLRPGQIPGKITFKAKKNPLATAKRSKTTKGTITFTVTAAGADAVKLSRPVRLKRG